MDMTPYPSNRSQALSANVRFYFTGNPCKQGHIALRYASTRICQCCQQRQDANNYRKSALNRTNLSQRYKATHKSQIAIKTAAWRKRNAGLVTAHVAARRSAKLLRTPSWANQEVIQDIYKDCEAVNTICRMYGAELFVVDHIVPLQGDTVSGLHVENNLQLLTVSQNAHKSNNHE